MPPPNNPIPSVLLEVDDRDLGPAMKALSPRHRAFVLLMFATGGGSGDMTKIARLAGYTDKGNGAIQVQAHRLAHREDVQRAIEEESRRRVKSLLPAAIQQLEAIMVNPQHKDQLKAVAMTLGRAGLVEVSESKHTHEVILTRDEKIAEIASLAKSLGRDPAEFLGQVVDADYDVVHEVTTGQLPLRGQRSEVKPATVERGDDASSQRQRITLAKPDEVHEVTSDQLPLRRQRGPRQTDDAEFEEVDDEY